MATFLTSEFLDKVKVKASLPEGRYEDSEILAIGDDILQSQLYPLILSFREEYFVKSKTYSITQSRASYEIPTRAYGLTLREAKKVKNSNVIDLIRIQPTEVITQASGVPVAFYLEENSIVLYPTPQTTEDTLLLTYFITPSSLVETSDAALITNISSGTLTATVPIGWVLTDSFDFVSRKNGHKCLAMDLTATNITGSDITFSSSDIPSSLEVGDYVCLAGESPYLQIPDAAFPLAVQLTANELLEDMGDMGSLQIGIQKAEQLKQNLTSAMNNRILGAPKRSRIRL